MAESMYGRDLNSYSSMYVGSCRSCGIWLRSHEHGDWCEDCCGRPLTVGEQLEAPYRLWAEKLGEVILRNIWDHTWRDSSVYEAAKLAGEYGRKALARDERTRR